MASITIHSCDSFLRAADSLLQGEQIIVIHCDQPAASARRNSEGRAPAQKKRAQKAKPER